MRCTARIYYDPGPSFCVHLPNMWSILIITRPAHPVNPQPKFYGGFTGRRPFRRFAPAFSPLSHRAFRTLCQPLLRLADFCGAPRRALAKTGALLRVAVTQIGVAHAVRLQIWTAAPAPARLFLPLAAPRLRSHSQLPASSTGRGRCSCPRMRGSLPSQSRFARQLSRGESQVHARGQR